MGTIGAVILIVCILGVILFYVGWFQPHMEEHNSMKEAIQQHNEMVLCKIGSTVMYFPPWWNKIRDGKSFNYHLKSFDGGKKWYAIDIEKKDEGLVILGLVEHVYPGLIEHLDGMDSLTNHVTENGSLDLTKKEDVEVLTDAGFTVSQK